MQPILKILRLFRNNSQEVRYLKEVAQVKQALSQTNVRLARLETDLEQAVEGYRMMLIQQNPEILPELITGSSPEQLDRALARARELTGRIKGQLEKETAALSAPGGAPVRSTPDVTGMSAVEKIRYGLERK